jgi:hypothetical protein
MDGKHSSSSQQAAAGGPAEPAIPTRALDRKWIEERLQRHFGPAATALAAARSEVDWCSMHPEYLNAVLRETNAALTADEAVLGWATARGQLWA